jgi:hypothetical protein
VHVQLAFPVDAQVARVQLAFRPRMRKKKKKKKKHPQFLSEKLTRRDASCAIHRLTNARLNTSNELDDTAVHCASIVIVAGVGSLSKILQNCKQLALFSHEPTAPQVPVRGSHRFPHTSAEHVIGTALHCVQLPATTLLKKQFGTEVQPQLVPQGVVAVVQFPVTASHSYLEQMLILTFSGCFFHHGSASY